MTIKSLTILFTVLLFVALGTVAEAQVLEREDVEIGLLLGPEGDEIGEDRLVSCGHAGP